MIAGFIETFANQTVLLASGLASGKEHRQYMIDGFTDTAGPKICFWQGAEAVYDQWVHGYCWLQGLRLARSRGGICLIGSWTLLAPRFAFRKEQRRDIIDGFTDTAGPGIWFWQRAQAVYN